MKFLKFYTFYNVLLKKMAKHQDLGVDAIHNDGSRKSGKSDNSGAIFLSKAMDVVDDDGNPIKASAIVVKKQKLTVDDVFREYTKFLPQDNQVKINKSFYRWDFYNGNYVVFKGWLNKNNQAAVKQGAGWASLDGEYIFVVIEEAYEFSAQDRQDIQEAIRASNKNAKVLFIYICNPWFPQNPYIQFLNRHLPYNIQELKTKGYQTSGIIVVDELADFGIIDKEYKPERMLFIHCNWRINEQLSQADINSIKKAKILHPQEANTTDYGMPGYSNASCFGNSIDNIGEARFEPKDLFLGGGDEGAGETTNSKTVFMFAGFNDGGYLDLYDMYVWDNTLWGVKSPDTIAKEVIQFYIDCRNEYYENTGILIEKLEVRVDKASSGLINILNEEAERNDLDWINFVWCSKFEIVDRTTLDNYYFSTGRVRWVKERFKLFYDELAGMVWENKNSYVRPKRKCNNGDHCADCFDYMIEKIAYSKMIANKDIYFLSGLLKEKGKKRLLRYN